MWVIPYVSESSQCPAVNISAAWKLEVRRANHDQDPDRYAVYAVFGPGVAASEDWVPLAEVAIPNSDQMGGRARAQAIVDEITDALMRGELVLDMWTR